MSGQALLVRPGQSIFGYDTRSLRSALVMSAVDGLNPFKREEDFRWRSPCVVSSIAGLGDLFIHLPLISGIVRECVRRGVEIQVALRPQHVEIGRLCGWNVLPFDNALEDFFKNPRAIRPADLWSRTRASRARPPELWIDLTGNAVSALAIKCAGAKKLAARVTRGGASLIDHPLPHAIQENEYNNRERIAGHVGCALDFPIVKRLQGEALPGCEGLVVLCLTTATRWKNWPLASFSQLIQYFPHTRFLLTGFHREVHLAEFADLESMLRLPNVEDGLDKFSTGELTRVIAHACAVVTNDTSAAHIANFFGVRGAVLFGPGPRTFVSRNGLKVFHDTSCPHYPCVQWRCRNEANWCMRKITPAAVADYLATLPGLAASPAL